MADGDTNLPPIERRLGLQIWGIEVQQHGNDVIYLVCVSRKIFLK